MHLKYLYVYSAIKSIKTLKINYRQMKNYFFWLHDKKYIFVAFLLAIVASSCKKKDLAPPADGDAKVKIVNAFEGSNAQDFYMNDTKLSATAVSYNEVSDYFTFKTNPKQAKFYDAGTQTINAVLDVNLNIGSSYTIFYFKSADGKGAIGGGVDDLTTPTAGKYKLRFANYGTAFSGSLNLSYLVSGEVLINGMTLGSITGFAEPEAGKDFKVFVIGDASKAITIPATEFTAGKIYTVWFDAVDATTVKYHVITQN